MPSGPVCDSTCRRTRVKGGVASVRSSASFDTCAASARDRLYPLGYASVLKSAHGCTPRRDLSRSCFRLQLLCCKTPLFLSGRCWIRTSDFLLVREGKGVSECCR